MELFEAILQRRSIRKYTNQEIPTEMIEKMLKSAMYAPSAMNLQPWHFVILDKRESLLETLRAVPHAEMLNEAKAAHGLGLGGVWVGIYPDEVIIKNVKKTFALPDHIIPVSLVSLGFPAEKVQAEERFKVEKIHYNKW